MKAILVAVLASLTFTTGCATASTPQPTIASTANPSGIVAQKPKVVQCAPAGEDHTQDEHTGKCFR